MGADVAPEDDSETYFFFFVVTLKPRVE